MRKGWWKLRNKARLNSSAVYKVSPNEQLEGSVEACSATMGLKSYEILIRKVGAGSVDLDNM